MAHSSHISVSPPSSKLCPNTLLPVDRHDHWCLGIQHLKEELTDPCLHCSMLAELDLNSWASFAQLYLMPRCAQKCCTSVAAGAPPTNKKSLPQTENYEHSLSKTVATIFSEMAEMKHPLQSLQSPASAAPTENTSVNESVFHPQTLSILTLSP